jgi:hypothetical protein
MEVGQMVAAVSRCYCEIFLPLQQDQEDAFHSGRREHVTKESDYFFG